MKAISKKPVRVQKAKPIKVVNDGAMRALLYVVLRGTPLFAANLRMNDCTAQHFEAGRIAGSESCAILTGAQGVSTSMGRVKGSMFDLNNSQCFDLSGVKRREVVAKGPSLARWAMRNGARHKVTLKQGPMKGTHDGYIVGKLDKMCVGFITRDGGKCWTLNTRSLKDGRNADRTFVLEK